MRHRRALFAALVAGAAVLAGPAPAGAEVVVTTPAEWRAAWVDPAAAPIRLGADLALDCGDKPGRGFTPLVVDGAGHTITDTCGSADDRSAGFLSNGPVTYRSLRIIGPEGGYLFAIVLGEVHLEDVTMVVRGRTNGVQMIGASTMVDSSVELQGGGTGVTLSSGGLADGVTVTGQGRGVRRGVASDQGPGVLRRSTVVVSGPGIDLSGPAVVEQSSVRSGGPALTLDRRDAKVVRDTTLVHDPALTPAGVVVPGTIVVADRSAVTTLDQVTVLGPPAVAGLSVGDQARADVRATVVAAGPCVGAEAVTSSGDNVMTDGSCALGGAGDRVLDDAGLEAYDPERGVAPPVAGGPLVDAASACGSGADQRGVSRPQGPGCDIGAVELVQETPPPTSSTSSPTTTTLVPGPGPGPGPVAPPATPATPVRTDARFTG